MVRSAIGWQRVVAVLAVSTIGLVGCGQSAGESVAVVSSPPPEPATLPPAAGMSTPEGTAPVDQGQTGTTSNTFGSTTSLPLLSGLATEVIDTQAEFPVFVTAPLGDDRIFIVGKEGTIWVQSRLGGPEQLVLDLRSQVSGRSEQGLLGLAFHPEFEQDRRAFVGYTDASGDSVVAQFQVAADGTFSDEIVLLSVSQPAANHNGGMVAFGPDGLLYVALGDGGGANDQYGNGNDPSTLLGTLLRLDVSRSGFAEPADDNPFIEGGGAPEVWAFGLRNPWRFAFDGDWLFVADVGQGSYEEINRVPADRPGLDFGWSRMEGAHCFSPASGCESPGLVLPIVEIPHGDSGTCSVTGGFVYRGSHIPELDGQYFYSDYCGGYLRSLRFVADDLVEHLDWTDQVGSLGQVTSFGMDGLGELLITSADGTVRRLVPER